jgi:hypothetical protein
LVLSPAVTLTRIPANLCAFTVFERAFKEVGLPRNPLPKCFLFQPHRLCSGNQVAA